MIRIFSSLLMASLLFSISSPAPRQYDFNFSLKTCFDADAEKYVVENKNIKRYREDFLPSGKYWGVIKNDEPGILTFHFPFEKKIAYARVIGFLTTTNFELNKKLGKGIGTASLWYSTNGKEWYLVKEKKGTLVNPVENENISFIFDDRIIDKKELWLQVRLQTTGSVDPSYSGAQFGRNTLDDPNGYSFDLRVKFKD